MSRLAKMKIEQSKADMQMSVFEKRNNVKRQKELEDQEAEMLVRFQLQQQMRDDEIHKMKAIAKAEKE